MFPENKKDIAVTNVYQYRSNHVFFKTGVLKNLPVFTEKHLCLRVFLIKLQASFSRIWTEYGEIRSISPYSVQMRENARKNADQNSKYGLFLRSEF